jgi:transposase-like protein
VAVPELINLASLIDDEKCYDLIRQQRWPDGIRCPGCSGGSVTRDGHDEKQRHRQRYRCKSCGGRFDDLTGTILAGHHQPLRVWVLCLYFMGLNLSNLQIARELGLNEDDVHSMASGLREGLVAKAPEVKLEGVVEIDEVCVWSWQRLRRATGLHPDTLKKQWGRGIGHIVYALNRPTPTGWPQDWPRRAAAAASSPAGGANSSRPCRRREAS